MQHRNPYGNILFNWKILSSNYSKKRKNLKGVYQTLKVGLIRIRKIPASRYHPILHIKSLQSKPRKANANGEAKRPQRGSSKINGTYICNQYPSGNLHLWCACRPQAHPPFPYSSGDRVVQNRNRYTALYPEPGSLH